MNSKYFFDSDSGNIQTDEIIILDGSENEEQK